MEKTISLEKQYSHNIADVWKAISEAEEITSWFIQADFKPEVGYAYTFIHEATRIVGNVKEANPVYKLVYTWEIEGTGVETTVSWTLTENREGTHLLLEHSGIENYPSEEMITNMFKSFSDGWKDCTNNLEKYLTEQQHA